MRLRKQNKWTRRLKKVATPAAAAGALAGTTVTTVVAGGKDALAVGPEAVQGFANVVKEVGERLGPVLSNSFSILSSLLSLGAKGLKFIIDNFVVLSITLGGAYVGYKIYGG